MKLERHININSYRKLDLLSFISQKIQYQINNPPEVQNSEPLFFISTYLNTSQWFVTLELLETILLSKLLRILMQSYLRKQIKTRNIVRFVEFFVADASSRSAEMSFLVMMR